MPICSICQEVLQEDDIPSTYLPPHEWSPFRALHFSVVEYIDAVDNRCYICCKFFRQLSPATQAALRSAADGLRRVPPAGDATAVHGPEWPPYLEKHFTGLIIFPEDHSTSYSVELGMYYYLSRIPNIRDFMMINERDVGIEVRQRIKKTVRF